jgi:two-component system LytT family response regulator
MLRRLLKDEQDIEIIGAPATGSETVEAINRLQPDLVFLDVKMPGMDGFDVIKQLHGRLPVIIFVTANEGYAIQAFEVHALDYLVKPCQPDRFQTALQRAREQLRQNQTDQLQHKLEAFLQDMQAGAGAGAPKTAERIAVKANGRILFLPLTDIDWVEAADNYVILHAGNDSHVLRETMTRLETKLPGERFLRISRSTIVNIQQIKELHPMFHGEYVVIMANGTRLTLTRTYREKLHQLGVS